MFRDSGGIYVVLVAVPVFTPSIMPLGSVLKAMSRKIAKTTKRGKPHRMSADEKRIVRAMAFEKKMAPSAIAAAVGRNKSSITRLLALKKATTMGRPKLLQVCRKIV